MTDAIKQVERERRKQLYDPEYQRKYNREVRKGLTILEQAEKEYEQIQLEVHQANMRLGI